MKVAVSSASFAPLLASGGLTQLEWLASCASVLGADGVVFAQAHFPRADDEYLAQVRKVTIDLGLVPVAVAEPRLFDPAAADDVRAAAVALAAALGALFVIAQLPAPGDVPPATFVAAVAAAKAAIRSAKAANITLLAACSPGTLAPGVAELRHFTKDVDSAWLRPALPAGIDRSELSSRDRVLLVTVPPSSVAETLAEVDEAARPWLLLEGPVDAARVAALRTAAARKLLAGRI